MPIIGKSGIFTSTGGQGQSITDEKLWPLFDPKSTRTDAVDWTKPQNNRLAFYDHHLRWTYKGTDGTLRFYRFDVDRGIWDGPHTWAFGGTVEYNQPEVQENLLIGGSDGNLYQESVAATTDAGSPIVCTIQSSVHKPDGFENDSQWGHINVDAQAPVGGVSVLASYGSTLTGFTAVGSCISTSRATQPMSLGDQYSCGLAMQFTWTGAGALYGYSILHRNDGQPITHCETPGSGFGNLGYGHAYRALVCLRSTAQVNCSIVVDNVSVATQPIPSTGNVRLRREIFFPLNKGYLCRLSLDGATPNTAFRIYPEDSSLEWQGWNAIQPTEVQIVFTGGNPG
jgi:hypothetical protein